MIVKRVIETYEDFVTAMQAKKSEDAVDRNEGKNALGNFRRRNPVLFDKFTKRYEGINEPQPIRSRAVAGDKEKYIREHPEINIEELRNKARERLMKGKYGRGISYDLPSWITERELLSSIETLTVPDMITGDGSLAQRAVLYRKCVKQAATSGRVDIEKLRQCVLSGCRSIWNAIKTHPNYPFEALKIFILEFATAEELADGGINSSNLIDIMFNKKISDLYVNELREREIRVKNEKLNTIKPLELRKMAKHACNYIQRHSNSSHDNPLPEFPLPENCNIVDLKSAIDKISDDELFSAFDGRKIDADKLYELCIRVLTNKDEKLNEIDMNAQGRKEIAKYIASLEEIKDKLESMKDDEEEKFDNMPEGLQESERGEAMQEAIEALERAYDSLEEVIDALQEIV